MRILFVLVVIFGFSLTGVGETPQDTNRLILRIRSEKDSVANEDSVRLLLTLYNESALPRVVYGFVDNCSWLIDDPRYSDVNLPGGLSFLLTPKGGGILLPALISGTPYEALFNLDSTWEALIEEARTRPLADAELLRTRRATIAPTDSMQTWLSIPISKFVMDKGEYELCVFLNFAEHDSQERIRSNTVAVVKK